jgi:hypothetical protein
MCITEYRKGDEGNNENIRRFGEENSLVVEKFIVKRLSLNTTNPKVGLLLDFF